MSDGVNRRLGLVLVAVVIAAALTGCSKTLDPADVEGEIKSQFTDQGLDVAAVTCPDDIEAKADTTAECEMAANNIKVPVEITVTDDEGKFSFQVPPEEARKLQIAGSLGG